MLLQQLDELNEFIEFNEDFWFSLNLVHKGTARTWTYLNRSLNMGFFTYQVLRFCTFHLVNSDAPLCDSWSFFSKGCEFFMMPLKCLNQLVHFVTNYHQRLINVIFNNFSLDQSHLCWLDCVIFYSRSMI